jgi:hypothetical protein
MLAKVINFISIFFILLSTINFCLETIPTFEANNFELLNCTHQNGTPDSYIYKYDDFDPRSKKFGFWIIETMCICFFTVEFILRYWSAPDRVAFIRGFMNLIDMAAIVPYYIDVGVNVYIKNSSNLDIGACPSPDDDGSSLGDKATFLMVLRVIRLARIVRIAKLSRHSRNLNTLIKTMSTSLRELSFLMLFFIVSMVLYATFVYYCEQGYSPGADDSANEFVSIPASFWWAIVTMTTVGYGDMYPRTPMGKVVGFMCALTGVLCIALPVPSIVSNFHRLYQEDQIMNPNGNNTYKDEMELKRCKLRKKFLNGDV